jgi:translation initiation factor 2 subunit 2
MTEEPLFDPSLKKRSKKKQVAFSEDPLGADADPTVPAPSLDDTIDLGPRTVHEQMKQSEAGTDDALSGPKETREEDDFKAMFGDLKKKKKKKEIPLDLVCPTYSTFNPLERRLFLTAG